MRGIDLLGAYFCWAVALRPLDISDRPRLRCSQSAYIRDPCRRDLIGSLPHSAGSQARDLPIKSGRTLSELLRPLAEILCPIGDRSDAISGSQHIPRLPARRIDGGIGIIRVFVIELVGVRLDRTETELFKFGIRRLELVELVLSYKP